MFFPHLSSQMGDSNFGFSECDNNKKNGKKRPWQGKVWCHKRKLGKISRITKIYMKWNIKEKNLLKTLRYYSL